ncbi:glycosyltransferase family 1 protein [Nocardioides sp. CER19]|uniref:glycosyltransferase family 4 protein n=1 Tax=Nocardioides sp. CER19 TaxID=3038538 RepID=UPI00244C1B70|nr:glycosyltransferase family 1 protein [Nocardioides sp. CER19]MDH2414177.1 glycosyltransferase family 1 protein [Nocardioides sp. CER19]
MTGRPRRWLLLATHVPASGSGGGMVRYCVELARALSARPDVELHLLCAREARDFATSVVGTGHVHVLPGLPVVVRSVIERSGPAVLPVLRQEWDVVHGAKHLLPRRAGRATRVLTVHDLNPLDRPGDFGPAKRMLLRRPYLASIADADVLVCVSAATRGRLSAWAPDADPRSTVVHLAASPTLLAAEGQPVGEVAGRRFVLVVGDPSPRKNLDFVLRLWPLVAAARPDATLAVVGPQSWGPTRSAGVGRRAADGQVALLGHRSDRELAWLYRSAAAVLCPSQLEGFGLPVVEAEALGAPVVISDDAAMGEVAGPRTVRISPHDPDAWRSEVLAALDRRPPGVRTGAATQRHGLTARTWRDVAAETVEAVEAVRRGG